MVSNCEREFSSGELEQVLNGDIARPEAQPLLHNHVVRGMRPRYMFCGVYNKGNYLSYCYNSCWFMNGRDGAKLQQLLCFGDSRCGSILASVTLVVFALLPFAAVWPFVGNIEDRVQHDNFVAYLVLTAVAELLLFFWHFHSIDLMKHRNCEIWEASWFTFMVKKEILKNMAGASGSLGLFDIEGKLRVIDVSVTDLCRMNSALHQISVNAREKLAVKMEKRTLDQAAVILYSEEFIQDFVTSSMYESFILAALSICSFALLTWKTIITMLQDT